MSHATRARRTLPALFATMLLAGGLLLGQTAAAPSAEAASGRTCNPAKLYNQARAERDRAAQLKRLKAYAESRRAYARADALQRRAKQCERADEVVAPPFGR
ncbi:hypothetical protein HHL19_15640 [Streptomyces sp. R302]|uniref:hypothetical protein n=1 Tax=unclassified Streptomyces TaxID=2593676 RepID=UPI00145D04BC|nr:MULTISPECIES: hypothetical protein [unclassified Streptomyces]NML51503.1 hypothetical protein [Streptomyces sp. R301]NML80081.1 hypothetical protein [Streptomyces sp. R302]